MVTMQGRRTINRNAVAINKSCMAEDLFGNDELSGQDQRGARDLVVPFPEGFATCTEVFLPMAQKL